MIDAAPTCLSNATLSLRVHTLHSLQASIMDPRTARRVLSHITKVASRQAINAMVRRRHPVIDL